MPISSRELLRSTHLSYSKLMSYRQCAHRFKLEYLDECEVSPSREIQLGSVVHAVLAEYLRAIQGNAAVFEPSIDDLANLLPAVSHRLREDGELTLRIDESAALQLLENFTTVFPRIDGRTILHVEAEKRTKLGTYQLKSILDLVLTNERREIHIIDFKTGNPRYVKDDQLRTYSLPILGASGHNGASVKLSYVFLRDAEIRSSIMHRHECKGVVDQIMEMVRTIEQDTEFEPNVTRLCNWCGVRAFCSAYQERDSGH